MLFDEKTQKLRPLQKSPSPDSRKPVFGFRLSGEGLFCKGLGLCGLLKEGAHGKSPKCLGGNLGDFGEFCKGLKLFKVVSLNTALKLLHIYPIPYIFSCI